MSRELRKNPYHRSEPGTPTGKRVVERERRGYGSWLGSSADERVVNAIVVVIGALVVIGLVRFALTHYSPGEGFGEATSRMSAAIDRARASGLDSVDVRDQVGGLGVTVQDVERAQVYHDALGDTRFSTGVIDVRSDAPRQAIVLRSGYETRIVFFDHGAVTVVDPDRAAR